MANLPILMDGVYLREISGTASYGRTLARLLESVGQPVDLLLGHHYKKWKDDGEIVLSIQVFGNEPPERRWLQYLRTMSFLLSSAWGKSWPTIKVSTRHLDLRAMEPMLPPFSGVIAGDAVFGRANQLFAFRGRMLEVNTPKEYAAAHWTSPMPLHAKGVPNIYTIHDTIPLQFPYMVYDRGGRNARLLTHIAKTADLIVTVSEKSKEHIVDILGVPEERVSVTYQATPLLPHVSQEDAERLVKTVYGAEPGKYSLFLGAIEPKKNLKRLIEAYLLANVEGPLLIAGPLGWMYEDDLAMIEAVSRNAQVPRRGAPDDYASIVTAGIIGAGLGRATTQMPIQRLGYLPRRHVSALLQCARFFVFPSVYEGFGLPALEAMNIGVPVLTSNNSSLPEVVGDAALQIDPFDVTDMAQGIRRLANDADLRAELIRRGKIQATKFTMETYRERLAAAYKKVGVQLPDPAINKPSH